MSLEFLELSKKVQEVNNLLSVVAYDSQSGKGAVLYDSQTTLELVLCQYFGHKKSNFFMLHF